MRWVLSFLGVCAVGAFVTGCGGQVESRGGGATGSGGAHGGVTGTGGAAPGGTEDTGAAGGLLFPPHGSTPPPTPIPPPPDDSCARFKPTYEKSDCLYPSCAEVSCPCGTSFIGCEPSRGCVVAVDCDVACTALDFGMCASGFDPCGMDADCATGVCVKDAGQISGECASGTEGARCRTDTNCPGGRCVAVDGTGRRACTTAKEGAMCNTNAQCDSGTCLIASGAYVSFIGVCTTGRSGSPCARTEDCDANLACIASAGSNLGTCSAANLGDPCDVATLCHEGQCLGVPGICSTGAIGLACNQHDQCISGFCGVSFSSPTGRACTNGDPGDLCVGSDQCKSGQCGLGVCG